jgi:Na+-driven multidrug efflux pump
MSISAFVSFVGYWVCGLVIVAVLLVATSFVLTELAKPVWRELLRVYDLHVVGYWLLMQEKNRLRHLWRVNEEQVRARGLRMPPADHTE